MDVGQVLYQTINYFFNIVQLLIIARIILSWIPRLRANQIGEFIFGITDPILAPFQRIVPPMGMLDISPMVAFVVLLILQQVLLTIVAVAFNLPAQ